MRGRVTDAHMLRAGRLIALLAAVCAIWPAFAQPYPSRPVRVVVPIAPGGIADTFARVIATRLGEQWTHPVLVENRSGAGGNIGADFVAKSPADGHTLVMGYLGSHAANPSLFKNMPYDPVRDFAAIIRVINAEGLIVVHPSVKAASLKELIALLKSAPGKYSYSSGGVGTAAHLAGELFKSMSKVDIVHIPYKGVAPAVADLVAGQVQIAFPSIPTTLPHVRAGRLRVIAVTDSERARTLPEVPTASEAGLPGYAAENWIGLFAPAGTPAEIVRKVNADVAAIMGSAELQERMRTSGSRFTPNSPEEFSAFVQAEVAKWAKVVREAGIQPE